MTDQFAVFPINPIQPGAYSQTDASALIASEQGPSSPRPAILGASTGGVPNVPLVFHEPQAAKSVLRSGALLDVVRAAFAGGAPEVVAIRAGAPIAGFIALAGATGSPILLTAKDNGVWTNSILRTVAATNKVTITYTDVYGTVYNEVFDGGAGATPATLAAMINGENPAVAGSVYVRATVQAGTFPLTGAAQAPLASGSDGAALIAGDWTTALTAIETQDVSIVVPATGDATVHAQVQTHCDAMSLPQARRERTSVFGGVLAESVATVTARMTALRNKRTQLVYPGISFYNETGVLTLYAPFVAAGYAAGQHCKLSDAATSLAHKRAEAVLDVETRLSTITGGAVDQLLLAGVTPLAPAPGGGFWWVDSLSGYNADESFRDYHKIRSADFAARALRDGLELKFVGGKGLGSTQGDVQQEASSICEDLRLGQLIKAYLGAKVSQPNARTYNVVVPVMLIDTTKYILITLALQAANTLAAGQSADDALA